jgi:hypothetical protein
VGALVALDGLELHLGVIGEPVDHLPSVQALIASERELSAVAHLCAGLRGAGGNGAARASPACEVQDHHRLISRRGDPAGIGDASGMGRAGGIGEALGIGDAAGKTVRGGGIGVGERVGISVGTPAIVGLLGGPSGFTEGPSSMMLPLALTDRSPCVERGLRG